MPHSFWFGHLAIVGRVTRKYPANLLSMILPQLLAQEYPDIASQGLLYIDCWPFAYPMIAAFHPDINAQFTQDVNLPKHPTMVTEFMPFTGCRDLLNMSGQEWKRWRAIFNPGFSPKNLTALIPSFLEEIEEFKDWLEAVAGTDEVVPLDTQACALATDVIGRATLYVLRYGQLLMNTWLKENLLTSMSLSVGAFDWTAKRWRTRCSLHSRIRSLCLS